LPQCGHFPVLLITANLDAGNRIGRWPPAALCTYRQFSYVFVSVRRAIMAKRYFTLMTTAQRKILPFCSCPRLTMHDRSMHDKYVLLSAFICVRNKYVEKRVHLRVLRALTPGRDD
ncbi:MAG: hypothetical protein ABWY27_09520, partial [Telluria sp.]